MRKRRKRKKMRRRRLRMERRKKRRFFEEVAYQGMWFVVEVIVQACLFLFTVVVFLF